MTPPSTAPLLMTGRLLGALMYGIAAMARSPRVVADEIDLAPKEDVAEALVVHGRRDIVAAC